MQTSDFEFELPPHLIAKYPTPERSASRLLHLDAASGAVTHYHFRDIIDLIEVKDLMVFNDTRVIPARFFASKVTGGKVEIMLERVLSDVSALVQMRSSKPLKEGAILKLLDSDIQLTVNERQGSFYRITFPAPGVLAIAKQLGHMPLPPYIDRADEITDRERYQTVFAEKEGAVAAPTAGLHFDDRLIQQLGDKGVASAKLTLHVGAGTFQPVRVSQLEDHVMHTEQIDVAGSVCRAVSDCRDRCGRTIAVGTTSVRSLESAASAGELEPYQGDTSIFIYPGYEFRVVDAMITNFHLSGSTLMMLVSAFAGLENVKRAYAIAIEKEYRFFSYGDAMLITR